MGDTIFCSECGLAHTPHLCTTRFQWTRGYTFPYTGGLAVEGSYICIWFLEEEEEEILIQRGNGHFVVLPSTAPLSPNFKNLGSDRIKVFGSGWKREEFRPVSSTLIHTSNIKTQIYTREEREITYIQHFKSMSFKHHKSSIEEGIEDPFHRWETGSKKLNSLLKATLAFRGGTENQSQASLLHKKIKEKNTSF